MRQPNILNIIKIKMLLNIIKKRTYNLKTPRYSKIRRPMLWKLSINRLTFKIKKNIFLIWQIWKKVIFLLINSRNSKALGEFCRIYYFACHEKFPIKNWKLERRSVKVVMGYNFFSIQNQFVSNSFIFLRILVTNLE